MIKKYILPLLLTVPLPLFAIEMVASQPAPRPVTARSLLPICGANDYVTVEPSGTRLVCKRLPSSGGVIDRQLMAGHYVNRTVNLGKDWTSVEIFASYIPDKGPQDPKSARLDWVDGTVKVLGFYGIHEFSCNLGTKTLFKRYPTETKTYVNACHPRDVLVDNDPSFRLDAQNNVIMETGLRTSGFYVKYGPRSE